MNPEPILSDELILKAQDGDEEAFGEIFERFVTPTYRFLFFRTGDTKNAERLTEEAFLRIWKDLHKFRLQGRVPLSAWIFQMSYATLHSYLERIRKMPPGRKEFLEEQEQSTIGSQEAREQKKLATALQELPDTQAVATILKYFCGLSNEEIALVLEKTEGAVRILQSRGLKRLREVFGE